MAQQMYVLDEIVRWFDTPHNVCELYLNYDMDNKTGRQTWMVCEQVCGALCTLAEQCSDVIAGHSSMRVAKEKAGEMMPSSIEQLKNVEDGARTLQEKALGSVCHVIRSMMDASGHVFMMESDATLRHKSISMSGGWEQSQWKGIQRKRKPRGGRAAVEKTGGSWLKRSSSAKGEGIEVDTHNNIALVSTSSSNDDWGGAGPLRTLTSPSSTIPASPNSSRSMRKFSVVNKKQEHTKTEEILRIAFEIITQKGLKKAMNYLIAVNFLTPSPRDVSNFLRVHQSSLDTTVLGDYLGEGGTSDEEYWNLIRYHYVRAISFEGMNVEQGLRHFLTSAGFRLPGEAQKIDRLITVFAQCFWEDNAGTACCPFSHQDTVFILAFSVIMLNTDLHKASLDDSRKKRKRKKMSKLEFMNNLRGVDNSADLSKDYLSSIYDSISAEAIEMTFESPGARMEMEMDMSRVSYKALSRGVKSAGEVSKRDTHACVHATYFHTS